MGHLFERFYRRVRVRLGDEARKVATMKWYSYVILLLMYIIYLSIGALVFQTFEKPHELNKCNEAKKKVRIKIEQFGDDYFYTLGLNNKFCDGIRKFNENKTNVAL